VALSHRILELSEDSLTKISTEFMAIVNTALHYYSLNDLSISEDDLLHGFGDKDEDILKGIDFQFLLSNLDDLEEICGGYLLIDNVILDRQNYILRANTIPFQIGPILMPRFDNLEHLAIIACTAGTQIENVSKKLMGEGDLIGGYSIDALGSVIVDKVLDKLQSDLNEEMTAKGFSVTMCYNPGYCRWPLTEQKKIFSILPDKFCGIILTDSCLMIPVKSITGFIGIGKNVRKDGHQCSICEMPDCFLRKEKYSGF
jgi:hypothetical protein